MSKRKRPLTPAERVMEQVRAQARDGDYADLAVGVIKFALREWPIPQRVRKGHIISGIAAWNAGNLDLWIGVAGLEKAWFERILREDGFL